MKKIAFAAIALLSITALQSCLNGDNENHGTAIYHRNGNDYTEMYADQTVDSLHILSYDSWTATIDGGSDGQWFSISDSKCNVPVGYIVTQSVIINTTPNKTGKARTGVIKVNSTYNEYGPMTAGIIQYGWHNITVPVPTLEKVEGTDENRIVFNSEINAGDNYALLACAVYANATLKSDADWLSVPNEVQTLEPGEHGVKFVVLPNNSAEDRVAHVTLTSNDVSTVVTYTQKGKK